MADRRTPAARAIREAGDPGNATTPVAPSVLLIGQIADGEYLLRSGDTIVGGAGGGGGGGAPTTARYLLTPGGSGAGLSDEREIALGTGLTATDGGAGSTYTISPDADLAALEALSGTGIARRTGANAWALATAAAVVNEGLGSDPPRIADTDNLESWANVTASGFGTSALAPGADTIWYTPFFAERSSATYDAITFRRANNVAGSIYRLGLYLGDGTNRRPGTLLWSTGDIATDTAAQYTSVFASGGTWEAAGSAHKDGSDRLSVVRGGAYWLAIWRNAVGSPTVSTIPIGNCRSLGITTASTWSVLTHYQESRTHLAGSWPATATPVAQGGQIPLLALRWV